MKTSTLLGLTLVAIVVAGIIGYYVGSTTAPTTTVTNVITKTITTGVPAAVGTVTVTKTEVITKTEVATSPIFKGKIKIGALLPLNLPIGQMMLLAIKMAVAEINAKGGVLGYEVEVEAFDTEWKADKAAEGYKYLAERGVKVVIGPFGSHEALAILDLLPIYEVLVLAPGAVSDEIDLKVLKDYNSYKYWFRTYVNATSQASATWDLLAFIARKFGYSKIAWIYEDLPWVIPHAIYGQNRSKAEGIEVVVSIGVKTDIQSFADVFAKVMGSGAQYITWQFSGTEDYVFARDYFDMQVPLLAIGGGTYAMLNLFYTQTQGKAEGLICISWGFPTYITPKTMEFYNKYKNLTKTEPIFTTWYAYDSVYIWAEAVAKAGSFDVDKVIKALETNVFVGTAGTYEFTRSHTSLLRPDRIYPIFFQWQGGKRVVIWPLRVVEPNTKILVPKVVDGKRVWQEISWPI